MALGNAAFGEVMKESWGRLVVSCPEDWLGVCGCNACEYPGEIKFFVARKKGSKFQFRFLRYQTFSGRILSSEK
jgi:hypothetical protein